MKIPRYYQSLHFSDIGLVYKRFARFFLSSYSTELWSVHVSYFHFIYKYREIYLSDGIHKLCQYYFNNFQPKKICIPK